MNRFSKIKVQRTGKMVGNFLPRQSKQNSIPYEDVERVGQRYASYLTRLLFIRARGGHFFNNASKVIKSFQNKYQQIYKG